MALQAKDDDDVVAKIYTGVSSAVQYVFTYLYRFYAKLCDVVGPAKRRTRRHVSNYSLEGAWALDYASR